MAINRDGNSADPPNVGDSRHWAGIPRLLSGAWVTIPVTVALSGVAIFCGAQLYYGSIDDAVAHFAGEPLSLSPAHVRVEADGISHEVTTESGIVLTLTLTNHTKEVVKIIGTSASCDCVLGFDHPDVVPPGEVVHLHVTIRNRRSAPPGSDWLAVFTDHPQSGRLVTTIEH